MKKIEMNTERAKKICNVLILLSCIFLLVGLISSKYAAVERAHKISKISVNVQEIESYKENGVFEVDLSCKVKNGAKTELDWVGVEISVYDKSGNLVGTINSSLEVNGLKRGKTCTAKANLEERKIIEGSLFSELYDSNKNDFKFKYKITSAGFTDGEMIKAKK